MKIESLPDQHRLALDNILKAAEVNFAKAGECYPVILCINPETMQVVPIELNGAPKSLVGDLIHNGRKFAVVIFISEAWMTHRTLNEDSAISRALVDDPATAITLPPHADPDRKEAVMVQFHHEERTIICHAYINREGDKPTLGEWQAFDNATPGNVTKGMDFSPPGARLASGVV